MSSKTSGSSSSVAFPSVSHRQELIKNMPVIKAASHVLPPHVAVSRSTRFLPEKYVAYNLQLRRECSGKKDRDARGFSPERNVAKMRARNCKNFTGSRRYFSGATTSPLRIKTGGLAGRPRQWGAFIAAIHSSAITVGQTVSVSRAEGFPFISRVDTRVARVHTARSIPFAAFNSSIRLKYFRATSM